MVDPNNPVKTPYDQKIQHLKQKIQQKAGPNNQLRDKLQHLKVKRFGQIQSTPTPIPWSDTAETMYSNATRDYNTANIGINAQRQQMEQLYGLNDTSNPFSRARMLQQSYQRNVKNTMNTYAGNGQLYAGSFNNAQAADQTNLNQGTDALVRAYQGDKSQLDQAGLQAKTAETDAYAAAQVQALQDALNTRPEGAPGLPKFVKKYYKNKIQRAEKHHKGHRADKLRKKLQNLKTPNPMTVADKPNG